MPNGLSKWNAGPYPWYIIVRQQFIYYYRELRAMQHLALPSTCHRWNLYSPKYTVTLCISKFLHCNAWSSYLAMHLPEKERYVHHYCNTVCSHLIDESEQVKQLSKNSINRLWSLLIIANLKAHNNTYVWLPALQAWICPTIHRNK